MLGLAWEQLATKFGGKIGPERPGLRAKPVQNAEGAKRGVERCEKGGLREKLS